MKKLHSDLLQILSWIDDIFTNNNIKYAIACGTALGYVREGKIIDWDDDIDLVVPEKYWSKAMSILRSSQNKRFQVAIPYENNYHMSLAKVFDMTTNYEIPEKEYRERKFENKLYIDIFRAVQTNKKIKPFWLNVLTGYYYIKVANHGKIINLLKQFAFWIPKNVLRSLIEKIIKRTSSKTGKSFYMHEMINRRVYPNTISKLKRIKLMGVDSWIANDSNLYLANHFGSDYMTPKKFNHGIEEKK